MRKTKSSGRRTRAASAKGEPHVTAEELRAHGVNVVTNPAECRANVETSKSPKVETESKDRRYEPAANRVRDAMIQDLWKMDYDGLVEWQKHLRAAEEAKAEKSEGPEAEVGEPIRFPWNPLNSFLIHAPDSVGNDMKGPCDIPNERWEAAKTLLEKGYVLGYCIADDHRYALDVAVAFTKRIPFPVILEHDGNEGVLYIEKA